MKKLKKETIIIYKFIYMLGILAVYLLGRSLPLYKIDTFAYIQAEVGMGDLLAQTISGDIHSCSLFALGIAPNMIAGIIIQVVFAFRNSEMKKKISQIRMNRLSLRLCVVIAIIQAFVSVQGLHFSVTGKMLLFAKFVAMIEMIAGAMFIIWLANRNKKYGIGGQSALIFVNLMDSIRIILKGQTEASLIIPIMISVIVMIVVIFMETQETRISVQRIAIHNIYEDKNYLAIKWNPIGVMPAMFSMAGFMLPQICVTVLSWIFTENSTIIWLQDNLDLSKPFGIAIYILILYTFTVGFSRVFINPAELTEQFLKNGDSLQNIHAGKDTKRYLSYVITGLGLLSATVMSVCLGIPMLLQMTGTMDSVFLTLPSITMMLTGIVCNLYREVQAIHDLESYEFACL